MEALGCSVQKLNCLDADVPDLLVGFRALNPLVEVKSKGEKLTEGQRDFFENWEGYVIRAETPEEAVRGVCHYYWLVYHREALEENWERVTQLTLDYLHKFDYPLSKAIGVVLLGEKEF